MNHVATPGQQDHLGKVIYEQLIAEPINKFRTVLSTSFNILVNPMYYAGEIDAKRLKVKDGFVAIGLSTFFAVIMEGLTGDKVYTDFQLGVPIVDDIIPFLLVSLVMLGTTIVYHFPVRLFGGKGSFANSFIIVSFLSLPYMIGTTFIFTFVDIYLKNLSVQTYFQKIQSLNSGLTAVFSGYLIPTFSVIHRLRMKRLMWVIYLVVPLLLIGIGVPAFLVSEKYLNPTQRKALDMGFTYVFWSSDSSANVIAYKEKSLGIGELQRVNDILEQLSWFGHHTPDSLKRSIRIDPDYSHKALTVGLTVKDGFEINP